MNCNDFRTLCDKDVVLLDGAMGSQLRAKGMPVGVSTELWAYEHPEVVVPLQRAYVDAGSDIIYAPTFSANRMGLEMHGIADRLAEINGGLVKLAKRAAEGRALVAGDFTTTGRPLEPVGTMSYQALLDIYREQVEAVVAAGPDLLVAETMLAIDECACFVEAARSVCDLPILCTLTIEGDGHLLFGGTIVEAVETLQALGVSQRRLLGRQLYIGLVAAGAAVVLANLVLWAGVALAAALSGTVMGNLLWHYPWGLHAGVCLVLPALITGLYVLPMHSLRRYLPIENIKSRK